MKRRHHVSRGSLRITRVGWGYLIIFLLLLMAAWNTGTNLLYIVVGGLLSFLLLSFLLSFLVLRKITLTRTAPKAAYRGHAFQVHVQVENHRRFIPAMALRLVNRERGMVSVGYIGYLPTGQAARLSVEECFEQRGEHRLGTYRVVCGFPFGLLERIRTFEDNASVLVYPRVHVVRASSLQRMSGTARLSTKSSDDGDEYYGLREYVPGDDIRRIVWRISARLGKWIVRELAQYQSRLVTLSLDTSYNPSIDDFEEHFEQAVELTASIAIMLLRRQYEVAIVTPSGHLEGGAGKGHERRVLEILARVTPTDSVPMSILKDDGHFDGDNAMMLISPDPLSWGMATRNGSILDPRELVHG